MEFSATYSPEDNKIRLTASERLPPELYARVKEAGFIWAPKQGIFVAPIWTPDREALALELAGEIEDEDKSLVERAGERADRFAGYSEKRLAESENIRETVDELSHAFAGGQPILVNHHSERKARKLAEKINNGTRKAINLWETANYWTARAAGAIRHAKYKERPEVRARRIKGLEADQRKQERAVSEARRFIKHWLWPVCGLDIDRAKLIAGLPASPYGIWSALDKGEITPHAARAEAVRKLNARIEWAEKWINHYKNRLTYERAMLAESGYTPPPKPKTAASLPLLNYPGEVTIKNKWRRGETETYTAYPMTKAEYAAINIDYKGTGVSACGTHRVRTAYIRAKHVVVFLTDSKEHARPSVEAVTAKAEETAREELAAIREKIAETEKRTGEAPAPVRPPRPFADTAPIEVKTVHAPAFFPTPPDIAREMAKLADIKPGHAVLEPSAGAGALATAAINRALGLDCGLKITAIEIDSILAESLRNLRNKTLYANESNFRVINADFMELAPETLGQFARVIMNPPFTNGEDVKHITHALGFLKPGGVLVALCANGPRQIAALKPLADHWEMLPAGSFKAAGTGVNVAILKIIKPLSGKSSYCTLPGQLKFID